MLTQILESRKFEFFKFWGHPDSDQLPQYPRAEQIQNSQFSRASKHLATRKGCFSRDSSPQNLYTMILTAANHFLKSMGTLKNVKGYSQQSF
jgi:hypothetical protein